MQVIKLDPNNTHAYHNRGISFDKVGQEHVPAPVPPGIRLGWGLHDDDDDEEEEEEDDDGVVVVVVAVAPVIHVRWESMIKPSRTSRRY